MAKPISIPIYVPSPPRHTILQSFSMPLPSSFGEVGSAKDVALLNSNAIAKATNLPRDDILGPKEIPRPSENDEKLEMVKDRLDVVKEQMRENIETVIVRGDHLGDLVEKSDVLLEDSLQFTKKYKQLRCKARITAARFWSLVCVILIIAAVAAYFAFR